MYFLGCCAIHCSVNILKYIYNLTFVFRERKRERERDDLWKKLENLSLTNAKKEGISLDLVNHHHTSDHSSSLNSE